jgi:hypothetical protein
MRVGDDSEGSNGNWERVALGVRRRWRALRRKPPMVEAVYFPCPVCGRPVDALNDGMISMHAEAHGGSR